LQALLFTDPNVLILNRHFQYLFFQKFLVLEVREGRTEMPYYKTAAHPNLFRWHTLLWEGWSRLFQRRKRWGLGCLLSSIWYLIGELCPFY